MFLSSLLVISLFKRAPKAVLEGWPVLLNRGSVRCVLQSKSVGQRCFIRAGVVLLVAMGSVFMNP